MFNKEWWVKYKDWSKETFNSHYELAKKAESWGYFPDISTKRILLDLGCGKLHLASQLFEFDCYLGVDLDPEPFYKADVYQEDKIFDAIHGIFNNSERYKKSVVKFDYREFPWESISGASEGNEIVVTSLFSTELYLEDPDKLYSDAFTKGKVDRIIAAGARYPGSDINIPFQEEGSKIYQTDPCPKFTTWRETRIATCVPSKMFGNNVVEVWRTMER